MSYLARFDEFHSRASELAGGLSDFGPTDYQEPLRLLLEDYDRYARFSEQGAEIAAGDIVGNLCGRLVEEAGFKANPEFASAAVESPIIIIGMARTGTTLLHRLIALDEQLQTLPMWLASSPMPRPPRSEWESHPAFQQTQQGIEQVYQIIPLLKAMHPQSAEAADECRIVLNHSFWSPGMMTSFADVPNYGRWVFESDARHVYERYRKVLGLIAAGSNKPWLLKDPDHIFSVETIVRVFPSARLVFTHRDPIEAMTSFGNIMFHSRSMVEPDLRPESLSQENLPGYWGRAMHKMEQARATIELAQLVDLHLNEISADPIAAVERIYDHFGMEASESARQAWHDQIGNDPRAGHGDGRKYTLEEFGLTRRHVWESVGGYMDRYNAIAEKLG